MKRIAVVTNARAGALVGQPEHGPSLSDLFREAGLQAEFISNDRGSLPERMQAALALAPDALVVAGGDGTVACAAQLLAGQEVPLGIIPFGTMNLLAHDLGLPVGDTAASVRLLAAWQTRRIDVGEVNGHMFLCASMLGLPARLGRYREELRGTRRKVWMRMARSALHSLLHLVAFRAQAEIGTQMVRVRAAAVTVTANPITESSGSRFARERLDGGALVLYVVDRQSAVRLIGFVLRVLVGRWRRDPSLRDWSAPALTLHRRGRATRVMNDGELATLAPPLCYRCHARALVVLAPA